MEQSTKQALRILRYMDYLCLRNITEWVVAFCILSSLGWLVYKIITDFTR